MGLLYFPIGIQTFPYDLVEPFIAQGYETFVETGTYTGENALKASGVFKKVITIEAAATLYEQAAPLFHGTNNVTRLLGDSREMLKKVLQEQKPKKVIFWLDAHYSGGDTFLGECPLADEIRVINKHCESSVVLVDDARFIDGYYNGERYMDISLLASLLSCGGQRCVSRVSDIFVAVPHEYTCVVDEYTEKASQKEFANFLKFNESLLKKVFMWFLKRWDR